MHARTTIYLSLGAALLCGACGSTTSSTKTSQTTAVDGSKTTFVSSWKSPTARPLTVIGAKVAAVVIMSDAASRRSAEDELARQINARGGIGVPMYSLVEQANVDAEPIARDALEKADVKGVVVLHPGPTESEPSPPDYTTPDYDSYWNGFYSYSRKNTWGDNPAFRSFVSVETLIYSLAQNQLVWAARSKTTSPSTLNALIVEVAAATATQLGLGVALAN